MKSISDVVSRKLVAIHGVAILAFAMVSPAPGQTPSSPIFDEPWIDGTVATEPAMQVQRYAADTFVIRQSLRTNFEGPFLYLLFGSEKALLLDTGAGGLSVRPTIDAIIADWRRAHEDRPMQLIVAHSHAHRDHIAGDAEFADRKNVRLVGTSPAQVAQFFGIRSWPDDIVEFDLGGRVIDVIPTPGHEASHIMIFDRKTRLLLGGDSLYPGRLYFPESDLAALRASIDRVVSFTRARQVSWILGAHIEMTRAAMQDYPMRAAAHPDERVLELPYGALLELRSSLHQMQAPPRIEAHTDFIVYPRH